jgi:hypothetical protein
MPTITLKNGKTFTYEAVTKKPKLLYSKSFGMFGTLTLSLFKDVLMLTRLSCNGRRVYRLAKIKGVKYHALR